MTDAPGRPKLPNFLETHGSTKPDKTALIGLERALTYGRLRERARALARRLYHMGLRPGDQAALMTYNLPEYGEIASALQYLGVGLVMVGYRMKPREIEFVVDNSDSRMLFFWHEFADRILPFRGSYGKVIPEGFVSFGGSTTAALDYESLFQDPPEVDLEDLPPAERAGSNLIYTSGTTGRPKGATRSTDFATKPGVMDYLFKTIGALGLTPDDVHLVCCPLYHSAPAYFSLVNFILGGTRVLQPRFDPVQFLELVHRHKVTSTHLVPTMVIRLLEVPEGVSSRLDLASLRSVLCGAAPLHPQHKLAFLDRFGDCLYEYYGSTETGVNTLITPEEMRERPTSVGKAFANNELKIHDVEGNDVQQGERGILYIWNPVVMEGYYKDEKATVETFRGKHITVGDVAVCDQEGYYYIVDRVKDMIIRGGVNIYPAEVEGVLNGMPGIADSAVVGKSDPELGEIVAAFIVRHEGVELNEDAVREHCGPLMENHKIPAIIVFTHEIPRTPTGKILKTELREMLKESPS